MTDSGPPPMPDDYRPTLPALLGPTPTTTRDRLERLVRIAAVEDVLSDESDVLRAELDDDADDVEAQTGGAYNVPVKGLGRVYRTDPEPKVYVADVDAFAVWLVDMDRDDLVDKRRIVEVRDHEALADALAELPEAEDDVGLTAELTLDRIAPELYVAEEVVVAEDALERLLSGGEEPWLTLVETDVGWTAMVAGTGELVDGVGVRIAARRLTVRPDSSARQRYADEFRALLGRQLTAGGDA